MSNPISELPLTLQLHGHSEDVLADCFQMARRILTQFTNVVTRNLKPAIEKHCLLGLLAFLSWVQTDDQHFGFCVQAVQNECDAAREQDQESNFNLEEKSL